MPHLSGVLFFPVTPFSSTGELNLDALSRHLEDGLAAGPGGVFAACGTGEFHALDAAESTQVVETAVRVVAGQVPVFAGAGGQVRVAVEQARGAARAGADGLLLMPPYLVEAPPAGLVRYVETVARATDLPVIVYHRGSARFDPAVAARIAELPSVIGLKDGIGDVDLMTQVISSVRTTLDGSDKSFQFFNGLPTAELTVPAYVGLGVHLYSSAVFCFAPQVALRFHHAATTGDEKAVQQLLDTFFVPLAKLRSKVPGYAVSLVKAGVRLRGLDVGGVRPPLIDPTAEHLDELRRIIDETLSGNFPFVTAG
ncbi:5-dehydro-4-deoxyglucarate dehydratase [Actinacidiphila oryziradicis]|uniref:Probable 5-dehydro-4-deoxyglucarate dehydratase n=1 Tax=Actinacidiphila oryziradicis TaxID=2571141 RepID=A0A4U0RXU1_9ACTN|nr:5-dehydro-4-deoxyglucarate dehydratase [Actinacidiphila oryziradicis]